MLEWTLYKDQFSTPEMRDVWSEAATIDAWLRVEQAISQCQADMGLIPEKAAAALNAVTAEQLDYALFLEDLALVGRPIVGFVKQLRTLVGPENAPHIHLGTTTQDIMDSATALQLKAGIALIDARVATVLDQLRSLSSAHGDTVMMGRTNSQHADPIMFGMKVGVWRAEVERRRAALADAAGRGLNVQFGGPVGDLAAFDTDVGPALKRRIADALGLGVVDPHWQNARDGIAEIVGALGGLSASLAKIAHNVNMLSASDVGELMETAAPGKGASSVMAHKANQRNSEFAEALGRLARQRSEAILETTMHEHERSGGVWIAEWVIVPHTFLLCSAALKWTIDMFAQLNVDTARMQATVDAHLKNVGDASH